jgi:hypothetical protein
MTPLTQQYRDYALLNGYLNVAINGTVDPSKSPDYPTTVDYGAPFFESYSTFPNTKYIHGFNLALSAGGYRRNLKSGVDLACRTFQNGSLLFWELGNEPDLYKTSAQGVVRPSSYDENAYVAEWLNVTRDIRTEMASACPKLATSGSFKFIAPSFAGIGNSLNPLKAWQAGLNADNNIAEFSSHKYVVLSPFLHPLIFPKY